MENNEFMNYMEAYDVADYITKNFRGGKNYDITNWVKERPFLCMIATFLTIEYFKVINFYVKSEMEAFNKMFEKHKDKTIYQIKQINSYEFSVMKETFKKLVDDAINY